jgi:hypothetical protein
MMITRPVDAVVVMPAKADGTIAVHINPLFTEVAPRIGWHRLHLPGTRPRRGSEARRRDRGGCER